MQTAVRQPAFSVADYLAREEHGQIRHEYVGGVLHAMAGASVAHNTIAGNIFAALRAHLRNGPCRTFVSDMKVHVQVAREDLFYYPDVVVTCHPIGVETHFLRFPTTIIEVLSETTEVIDRREKLSNYRHLSTLEEYVLVAQDRREVMLHRRVEGWAPLLITAPQASLELAALKSSLPLAAIYENVELGG